MRKDTVDTLLLRHYGNAAPTPVDLEQRLHASVSQRASELHRQQQVAANLRQYRVTRRRAVKLVAVATASLGMLSVGLEIVGSALSSQDTNQPAYS